MEQIKEVPNPWETPEEREARIHDWGKQTHESLSTLLLKSRRSGYVVGVPARDSSTMDSLQEMFYNPSSYIISYDPATSITDNVTGSMTYWSVDPINNTLENT